MDSACVSLQDVCLLVELLTSSLKELDLTSCVVLTDSSVRSIASCLPGLQVLRLGSCKLITDWGLLGMEEPNDDKEPSKHSVRDPHVHKGGKTTRYYTPYGDSGNIRGIWGETVIFLCLKPPNQLFYDIIFYYIMA